MSVVHHLSVGTNDVAQSRAFYDAVLAVVGLRLIKASDRAADWGVGDFLFSVETPVDGRPASAGNGAHVAFAAVDREMVDRFHAAGLANGGTDAGAPGLRPEYDPNYYGAFLLDPDSNKVEAVTYTAT